MTFHALANRPNLFLIDTTTISAAFCVWPVSQFGFLCPKSITEYK